MQSDGASPILFKIYMQISGVQEHVCPIAGLFFIYGSDRFHVYFLGLVTVCVLSGSVTRGLSSSGAQRRGGLQTCGDAVGIGGSESVICWGATKPSREI